MWGLGKKKNRSHGSLFSMLTVTQKRTNRRMKGKSKRRQPQKTKRGKKEDKVSTEKISRTREHKVHIQKTSRSKVGYRCFSDRRGGSKVFAGMWRLGNVQQIKRSKGKNGGVDGATTFLKTK